MADEKSIWKKELSFRRKPADEVGDAPAEPGSSSLWKKEISFRKKDAAPTVELAVELAAELAPEPTVPAPVASELDAAIAALSLPAPAPVVESAPVVLPAPPIEHDWLTQPLEEVSEPPAEPVSPIALVPTPAPALVPVPEPELELVAEPELDLPTAILPPPELESAWPEPAPEPELAPEAAPEAPAGAAAEPVAKLPFYKKELSFKRTPKAEQPAKEPKPARVKRERKEKPAADAAVSDQGAAASDQKVPFYKRELSFKRSPKEWDAGEGLTEEPRQQKAKARPKLRRPPRPRPSLPSLPTLPSFSRGGGAAKHIVGLKIGASQIAAARIRNGESPELIQAARTPLDHGIVVNGELRDPEALALALRAFFAEHKLPKRGIRLGIANNRIGVRTFEVTGIDDPKQLANAIRFRAQEVLPIPLEEAVLDYQILSEGVDQEGKPLRRVLLVVAYRELVDRYVYACRKAGLQIVGIDLEAFALLRTVAAPHDATAGHERGALVAVSVGHDRSTFAVSDGRVCEFTRVLEWGGWSLNIAIARALELAPSEVETVKRALSFAGAGEVPEGYTESQLETAREAARRQLQTFARELVSSLQFYQNQPGSLGIGEIALTGGTAHLPGLGVELERLIGVPVRVVDPLGRIKVSKNAREPEQVGSLAVAIGLGIED